MNSIINSVGGIIRLCFSIITIPVLIRVLGISSFGEYALITAVINLFSLAEWSIAMAATVFLSKTLTVPFAIEKEYERLFSSVFIILLIVVAVLFCFFIFGSPLISHVISNDKKIAVKFEAAAFIIAVNLSLRSLQQFFIGVEQAHQAYTLSNLIATAYSLALAIATIASAYVWHDIIAIITAQSLTTGLFVVIHCIACVQKQIVALPYFLHFSPVHLKLVTAFSLKTWFGAFGGLLFLQGDKILINRLMGIEVTGMYAALTSVATQINSISALPTQPIVPAIGKFISSGKLKQEVEDVVNVVRRAFLLNAALAVTLGVTTIIFAPEIVSFLGIADSIVGKSAATYLIILSSIYTVYSLNATGFYCLYASGQETYIAGLTLFSSVASLVLIAGLIVWFGPVGAFVGNIGFICTLLFLKKAALTLGVELKRFTSDNVFTLIMLPVSIIVMFIDLGLIGRVIAYLSMMTINFTWLSQKLDAGAIFARYTSVK